MPRYKKDTSVIHLSLPLKHRKEIDEALIDKATGRVPYGGYSKLMLELFDLHKRSASLDLSQWGFAYTDKVWGSPETIKKLETLFNKAMTEQK
jgi:hypothetical protein